MLIVLLEQSLWTFKRRFDRVSHPTTVLCKMSVRNFPLEG